MADECRCAGGGKHIRKSVLKAESLHQHALGKIEPKAIGEGGD